MNPIVLLLSVVTLGVFESYYLGDDVTSRPFPEFEDPTSGWDRSACEESGSFLGRILDGTRCAAITVGGWLAVFFGRLMWLLRVMWFGITYLGGLLTYDMPGAPIEVRVIVTTFHSALIGWTIVAFIRGYKA